MGVAAERANGAAWLPWDVRCVGVLVALCGCRAEAEMQPSVRVEPLLVAPAVASAPPRDAACEFVEGEAQKLNASMPRRLDQDTAALGVRASGCDLSIEYQMLNLDARDVAPNGMHAMRSQVVGQLCADTA